jgi:HSP20 family protein
MLSFSGYRFSDLHDEMARASREMSRWFDHFRGTEGCGCVFPPVNVYDEGESYTVRAEIPGVDPQELEIKATARNLTIKGERQPLSRDDKVSYHRRERDHGVFNRSIALPQPIDPDKIVAAYENGVLELTLPKADEVRARRIEISN